MAKIRNRRKGAFTSPVLAAKPRGVGVIHRLRRIAPRCYVYIRNLMLITGTRKNQGSIIFICVLFPIVAFLGLMLVGNSNFVIGILNNRDIPLLLLIWGSTGQIIFSFRFVYQWVSSERQKESVLPLGFWIISLLGATMLIIYAIVRLDPVLFFGQLFGTIVYTRNIIIHYKHKKQSIPCKTI